MHVLLSVDLVEVLTPLFVYISFMELVFLNIAKL